MYSKVLRQLETLKSDLERIDPAGQSDAADQVAEMAVALRRLMRGVPPLEAAEPTPSAVRTLG